MRKFWSWPSHFCLDFFRELCYPLLMKNTPISILTPELGYLATVRGRHVFSNGFSFSIDEKLPEEEMDAFVSYMDEEGFLPEDGNWIFLT